MKTEKNSIWNFYENIEKEQAGECGTQGFILYG